MRTGKIMSVRLPAYRMTYPMQLLCNVSQLFLYTAGFSVSAFSVERAHKEIRIYDQSVIVSGSCCRYHRPTKLLRLEHLAIGAGRAAFGHGR